MNSDGIFSIRFLAVLCAGISLFICWGMVNISKNIEGKVKDAKAILKDIQQEESPDPEKTESLLKVAMVSGVRG